MNSMSLCSVSTNDKATQKAAKVHSSFREAWSPKEACETQPSHTSMNVAWTGFLLIAVPSHTIVLSRLIELQIFVMYKPCPLETTTSSCW